MYSQQLQDKIALLNQIAHVDSNFIRLLNRSMASYLQSLASYLNADIEPQIDPLLITLDSLFLSQGLSRMDLSPEVESGHYLVGMALEQSGDLLSRKVYYSEAGVALPLENDIWYRLLLSFLHYLAGGYRVQALSVLNHLDNLKNQVNQNSVGREYQLATEYLWKLFNGRSVPPPNDFWGRLLFGTIEPQNVQEAKIKNLASQARFRRQVALSDLGLNNETEWLRQQGVVNQDAPMFWSAYLENLKTRSITNFTHEQQGPNGFQDWLQVEKDLLVILPTGSGKSIIGELRTALTLAQGKQVVWLSPSRALVRQTKRELFKAFYHLGVRVEELPITEDFNPLIFEEISSERFVAATTPEKLTALIRANPDSIRNVELVVLDEAQKLFDLHRGTTIEYVLSEIQTLNSTANFVIMSAQTDSVLRLQNFIHRLRGDIPFAELISEDRPTRRIYGVITDIEIENRRKPQLQIYPPGLQEEDGETSHPYQITMKENILSTRPNQMDIARPFIKKITTCPIKTAVFVYTPLNTETQSQKLTNRLRATNILPLEDLARLQIELGRESIIKTYGEKGVSPHHGGLTPLEQHIVEKWMRKGVIKTIVATSTLAEGVNLPFDVSIIVSTKRRVNEHWVEIPLNEIQNMIGRAGRAGHVSDGLCLVAIPHRDSTRALVVDSARRYFFRREEVHDYLGLSRLLLKAIQTHIFKDEWLFEYNDLDFGECQTLINFLTNIGNDPDFFDERLRTKLLHFPSIQDLQEIFEGEFDVITTINSDLVPFAQRIINICENNSNLYETLSKTGMPIEILRYFLRRLDERDQMTQMDEEEIISWADEVVQNALDNCRSRMWYQNLFENITQERLFEIIQSWRNGSSLHEIENQFPLAMNNRQSRIKIGKLLNHKFSMFAQFWGALSVCERIKYPGQRNYFLNNIQSYIREGVSSITQLAWLNCLGGVDRVLAHQLSRFTPDGNGLEAINTLINEQYSSWRRNRRWIPNGVEEQELAALHSIFEE
jgi:superfamily II DNA/RNA helicase